MTKQGICCHQLEKSFKNFHLGPIDVSFPAGKITCLFGPNGAGKTTLLSLLTGAIECTGEITYDFPSISYGGVFDQSFLLPHTTVLSQLTATAKISDRDDNVCKSIIDECNIAPYLKHHISKLSTGNKQRLSLALSLLQDPDVYILDEPLNGLDPEGIEWFNRKVRTLASEQKVVIFATHLLAEAEAIVDRTVFLMDGHIIYAGSIQDIATSITRKADYVCLTDNSDQCIQNDTVKIYCDKLVSIFYDPHRQLPNTVSLEAYTREHNIPLTALYRLKSYDFKAIGGTDK